MPTLTIKTMPDEIYSRLKETAKRSRRSMNSENLVALEDTYGSRRQDREELLADIRTLRKKIGPMPHLTEEYLDWAKSEGRS